MSPARVAVWLAMLITMAGCSWFSWLPWVGDDDDDDEAEREPAELVRFDEEVRLKALWSRDVGKGLGKKYLRLRAAVLADRVYAADGYGTVMALDRFTGKPVWEAAVDPLERGFLSSLNFLDRKDPSFVSGGVGTGGGNIFIGTTTGYVVALSAADGSEVWRSFVDSEVLSTPVAGEGLVFLQTIDGRLVALEDETGEQRWSFNNQVPVLTLRGTSSPVYSNGVVISGFSTGKVSVLRASNGEPAWEHRLMLPEGRSELDRIVDVDGQPLVVGGTVYAGAYQGRVKALRMQDGTAIWERDISTAMDLAEGYGQIYAIDSDDEITAIDRDSAEIAWTSDAFYRRKLSPPAAFSNYLLTGDDEGYLHVLAQSDGRMMGRRKVDGKGIRSAIVVADSVVYVLGNSGKLVAYEIEVK